MEGLGVADNNSVGRRRKKLTAREKWQIYQEANAKNAPIGEILRRHGLYSAELTKSKSYVKLSM